MNGPEKQREGTGAWLRRSLDIGATAAAAAALFGSLDFLFGLNAGGWQAPAQAREPWRGYATGLILFIIMAKAAGWAAWVAGRAGGWNPEGSRRAATWVGMLAAYGAAVGVLVARGELPDAVATAAMLGGVTIVTAAAAAVGLGRGRGEEGARRDQAERIDGLFVSAAMGALMAGLAGGWGLTGRGGNDAGISVGMLGAVFAGGLAITALVTRLGAGRAVRWVFPAAILVLVGATFWPQADEGGSGSPGGEIREGAPRRIVLITIDTLRTDALGCYLPGGNATPNIDALAARGTRYAKAISAAPWTLPAFASMMTGTSVALHETTGRQSALPEGLTTLAERLREAGYATGGFGSNYFLRKDRGFGRGFDAYRFYPRMVDVIDAPMDGSIGASVYNRLVKSEYFMDVSTTEIAEMGLRWTRKRGSEPHFLWVHFFDPHGPYAPPEGFRPEGKPEPRLGYEADVVEAYRRKQFVPTEAEKAWLRELYLAETRYVDAEVGWLLEALEATGGLEETLVVLTSDHGEEFWDHGDFEHGHTLYQELIHVPLILAGHGVAEGEVVEDYVSLTSLYATVLGMAGLEVEGPAERRTLPKAGAEGAAEAEAATIFAAGTTLAWPQEAAIREGWKLSQIVGGTTPQLFDLESDPRELTNREAEEAVRVEALRGELAGWYRRAAELREAEELETGGTVEVPDEVLDALEKLGYLN